MSWREPFTGWNTTVSPQESDFNRIEGNTEYLKDAVDTEVTDRESAITSEASARESADNSEASARESADNVINARTPQSYKTTDSIILAGLTLTGPLILDTTPSTGTTSSVGGAGYLYFNGNGLYDFSLIIEASGSSTATTSGGIEKLINGVWAKVAGHSNSTITTSKGGIAQSVISSGSNIRVYASGSLTRSVKAFYQKY